MEDSSSYRVKGINTEGVCELIDTRFAEKEAKEE